MGDEDHRDRRRSGDVQLEILTERVTNFMDLYEKGEKNAEEWRSRFCVKLDSAIAKIDGLPCPARIEETKALTDKVQGHGRTIWTILIVGIPALLSLAVAWGAVTTTVWRDSGAIKEIAAVQSEIGKEVVVLKNVSQMFHGTKADDHGGRSGKTGAEAGGGLRVSGAM